LSIVRLGLGIRLPAGEVRDGDRVVKFADALKFTEDAERDILLGK
jgi:hypothetical protein